MKPTLDDQILADRANRAIWITLIGGCGVVLSTFFACVTPFAALATITALKLDRRDGLLVVGLIWLANQAIGYGYLGYPWTWDSLAWGVAIGFSAGMSMLAAGSLSTVRPAPLAVSLPFVAAFAAFELTLYTAGFILPGSSGTFAIRIVGHIFLINAVTLCALMIIHQLVVFVGRPLNALTQTTLGTASPR